MAFEYHFKNKEANFGPPQTAAATAVAEGTKAEEAG
jgi:hypothetical protein